MRAFLDNTGVHRIYTIINSPHNSAPIREVDAVALLHFAEHILFADTLEISEFESDKTREITNKTIELLKGLGCIEDSNNKTFLSTVDFTENDYAKACILAAPKIQEDIQTLNPEILVKYCSLADEATKPIGITTSVLDKWITQEWPKQKREEIRNSALDLKAKGAYDYILASNDGLFHQFKALTEGIKNSAKLSQITLYFDVFFRIAINEELARQRKGIYTPAPQRAKVVNESDQMFRYAICKEIEKKISDSSIKFPSKLLEKIKREQILPIPMFAIHFLRNKKIKSPISMLECAGKLRETPELEDLRKWLTKWENLYGSTNIKAREKALQKLKEIEADLSLAQEKWPLFSVFRGDISHAPDGTTSFGFDFSDMGNLLAKLFTKFSRRKIFLSMLHKEFSIEKEIGADINRLIGRAIID